MNRLQLVRWDRDERKEAHDRYVNELSVKTTTLLRAENDLRESARKLGEQGKLVIQLAARITELELDCKDSSGDAILSTPAQQRAPPTSLGGIRDIVDEAATKKASKGKFQLPSILGPRSASDLNEKMKAAAAVASTPAAIHVRVGSDSSMSMAGASTISRQKQPELSPPTLAVARRRRCSIAASSPGQQTVQLRS